MISERILVVDDDEGMLFLVTAALNKQNYDVSSANSGAGALQLLRKSGPYAVLLTDLMMPDMNGLELLREARKQDPSMEAVVLTAGSSVETAIIALKEGGAYDYLLKPLSSIDQLALVINRAISHRKLRLERETLQLQVQNEAERFRELIANTGDAILSADTEGILTIANPAAMRLLGQEDLIGNPALVCLPPSLAALVSNWQAISPKVPALVEIPWKDGTIQMTRLTPIFDRQGTDLGWVMVLRDITHMKQLDELKTQSLSEAANKIRLPLAEAMNSLVKLNILASKDPSVGEVVYRLNRAWENIQKWMDELLSIVHIDSELKTRPTNIHLLPVLESLRPRLNSGLVQEKKLVLDYKIDHDLPQVRADPELLSRLLQSLVGRAAIRSETGKPIRIEAREHKGQVWINVSDGGPPVGDEDLLHIFDKSLVRMSTGSLQAGYGLAMVKTITDRMDGQVWVGGQGPKGSTITVCLPAVDRNGGF